MESIERVPLAQNYNFDAPPKKNPQVKTIALVQPYATEKRVDASFPLARLNGG